jgi:hypothetical protein
LNFEELTNISRQGMVEFGKAALVLRGMENRESENKLRDVDFYNGFPFPGIIFSFSLAASESLDKGEIGS